MNNTLVLITKRFPFFKTEAFLESEIDILAKRFDTITVFPYEIDDYCRNLPDNVIVNTSFASIYGNKRKRALKTIVSFDFLKAIWRHRTIIRGVNDLIMLLKFISNFRAYLFFFDNHDILRDTKLIYTYWFNEATYSFLKLREINKYQYFVISRAHRFDLYENLSPTRSFWPYRKEALNMIDTLYSISDNGKDYLEDKYGHHPNIVVSRLGVYDKNRIARRSGPNHLSIVSVSRIVPIKRVELIKSVIHKYALLHPEISILWTHFGDGEYMDSLRQTDILPSNFALNLKGYVKNENVYEFYSNNSVDLFINLSSTEGIPVSIMEAISFGIPVLATNVGGTAEIVGKGTGKLVNADSSLDEIVSTLDVVLNEHIPSELIRIFFIENFNAVTNYSEFSHSLYRIIN